MEYFLEAIQKCGPSQPSGWPHGDLVCVARCLEGDCAFGLHRLQACGALLRASFLSVFLAVGSMGLVANSYAAVLPEGVIQWGGILLYILYHPQEEPDIHEKIYIYHSQEEIAPIFQNLPCGAIKSFARTDPRR